MTVIQNPILTGFHPDPSILRVGDNFYLANSTFEYFPGIEIHHSTDLVNWTHVASPLQTSQYLNMLGNEASTGVWAPCLSYSNGQFYLIFTDVKEFHNSRFFDTPNYVTTAPSIEGPWSEPVYLNSSGFDPSLFHDEDGRKWYTVLDWDWREDEIVNRFSGILLQEYDDETKSLIGPTTKIFTGTELGITEGPHLYKKDGYYYLVTAEGGTSYGHAVTVARSKTIEGPYELHPAKQMMTANGKDTYLQKSGHASFVEDKDGQWYMVYLCGRPLPGTDRCILGRETAIEKIQWIDGWPYLASGKFEPSDTVDFPNVVEVSSQKEWHYTFGERAFLRDFKTLRIPFTKEQYELSENDTLRIIGKQSLLSRFKQSVLCRRQQHFHFLAECKMTFHPEKFQHTAGLIYRYDERNQYYLYVSYDEKTGKKYLDIMGYDAGDFIRPLGNNQRITFDEEDIYLRAETHISECQFSYSFDGKDWHAIGAKLDASILSDDYDRSGFTGAFVGMACQDLNAGKVYADFHYFRYKGMD